jgi:hypothetical protein
MPKHLSIVIPDAAQRRSGIHIPCANYFGKTGVMDSGFAPSARPGMTVESYSALG